MANDNFAGDKKAPMVSPFAALEHRFIDANWRRFPPWIEGWHLTMLTVLWSLGMLWFGRLAVKNLHWLWLSSLMIFLQWFTDCFDGALGRGRERGLIKWGYYMDHFLDFVFMGCVVVGYAWIAEPAARIPLYIYVLIQGMLWVNAFLDFACCNEFRITHLGVGPTEIRLGFMVLNTVIIFKGAGVLTAVLPWLNALTLLALIYIVYHTQKRIWEMDMAARRQKREES